MSKKPRIKLVTSVDDPRYVKALSHPLRIRILALLGEESASPVQLAQRLDATLGTTAYHVRTLEQLGLIEMVATHQRRGATEHVFAARPHPQISDDAWAGASPMAKHVFVSSLLSQVGEYATQSAARGGFDRHDAHASRTPLKLDEKGWSALAEATKKWLDQVERIEAQSHKRSQRTGDQPIDAGLVILLFEAIPFSDAAPATNGAHRSAGRAKRRAPVA